MSSYFRNSLFSVIVIMATLPGCTDSSTEKPKLPRQPRLRTPGLQTAAPRGLAQVAEVSEAVGVRARGLSYPLGPGDPAPPLMVSQYVHGDAIDSLDEGHIYVVKFWATFCGTCLQTMPYLAELQEKYADDVTMIGVTTEDAETISDFLNQTSCSDEKWSEVINCRIALDDHQKTQDAWCKASEHENLPFVVIVGRTGLIEWMGHPASMLGPLEAIVNGEWDFKVAQAAMRQDIEGQRSIDRHQQAIVTAVNAGNYREAVGLTERMMKSMPDNPKILALQKQLSLEGKMYKRLDQVLVKLFACHNDAPLELNSLAWDIAVEMDVPQRNLDLALKAALRASELTRHQSSTILDTVARVYFERGELGKAIIWQEKAVKVQCDSEQLTNVLEKYRSEFVIEASGADSKN